MFEDLSIPVSNLSVGLKASTNGVFEPVSCLMFLNLTGAEFLAWKDDSDPSDPIGQTFMHEMYHYFQVLGTGYMFDRYLQLVSALRDAKTPLKSLVQMMWWKSGHQRMRLLQYRIKYFWMPRDDRNRVIATDQYMSAVLGQMRLQQLVGGLSQRDFMSFVHPGLPEAIDRVHGMSQLRGASGLSAQDVFESSAAVFAIVSERQHDGADVELRQRQLDDSNPYERLPRIALARAGDRPVSRALLAASALALRFEAPGEAVLPIMEQLIPVPFDAQMSAARELDLTSIKGAGRLLGTARDVRAARAARK